MNVKLIAYTKNPEKIISCAAKLCYSESTIDQLLDHLTDEKASDFIGMLMDMGHESPIEHVCFTFGIEEVSRALLAQITRHRIASFSVQSQRYVNEDNFTFIVPPEIEKNCEAKKIYIKSMEDCLNRYNKLVEILQETHKNRLVKEGIDEKKCNNISLKQAIEDARFVLPNACSTKMLLTMNARSLLNFFTLRCCNRAQWEIRELAIEMLTLVNNVAPTLFKLAGPSCIRGKCSEGKMSCSKMVETKEKFDKIKNLGRRNEKVDSY